MSQSSWRRLLGSDQVSNRVHQSPNTENNKRTLTNLTKVLGPSNKQTAKIRGQTELKGPSMTSSTPCRTPARGTSVTDRHTDGQTDWRTEFSSLCEGDATPPLLPEWYLPSGAPLISTHDAWTVVADWSRFSQVTAEDWETHRKDRRRCLEPREESCLPQRGDSCRWSLLVSCCTVWHLWHPVTPCYTLWHPVTPCYTLLHLNYDFRLRLFPNITVYGGWMWLLGG